MRSPLRVVAILLALLPALPAGAQEAEPRKPAPQAGGAATVTKQNHDTALRLQGELQKANIAQRGDTSYLPVIDEKDFAGFVQKMQTGKPDVMRRQQALLEARYDLANRRPPASRCPAARPSRTACASSSPAGTTWEQLARMTPDEIRNKDAVPARLPAAAAPEPPRGRHALPASSTSTRSSSRRTAT